MMVSAMSFVSFLEKAYEVRLVLATSNLVEKLARDLRLITKCINRICIIVSDSHLTIAIFVFLSQGVV